MFGRLLKYELKATSRVIPFAFLISFLFAIFHFLLSRFLGDLAVGASFAFLVLALVTQFIIVWVMLAVRYYKSMYGAEAYLTHTLPTSSTSIFWSKFLVAFGWFFVSVVYIAAMVAGLFANLMQMLKVNMDELGGGFEMFLRFLGIPVSGWGLVLVLLFFALTVSLGSLITLYFAVTAGSTSVFGSMGMGGPVIMYILVYIGQQILGIFAGLLIPISLKMNFVEDFANHILGGVMSWELVFESTMLSWFSGNGNAGQLFPLGSYILNPIIYTSMILITVYLVKRKTSLR